MVLRVEKKLFVIEKPISPAPPANSKYLRSGMRFMMLIMRLLELKSMFEKQAGVERFDLIQTFHACKQEEGKSVSSYILKMKEYVEQLKRLGKGKRKGNGKDKSYIPKPKNPKPSIKEHPTKNDASHHCKEVGHCKRNCPAYLVELIKKKKQVDTASSSVSKNNILYFNAVLSDGIYEIDILNLVPNDTKGKRWVTILLPTEIKLLLQCIMTFGEKSLSKKSARTHRDPKRLCLNVEVEEHSLGDLNESNNYKAAILDLESDKWVDAMNAKMHSVKDNRVWCLVDLPPNCKTVGNKWLIKKMTDMDNIVHTYKARLVAKGFTQTYEVDYEETFSPVADTRAIRILIAITAFYDYEIWQMDVKTAFLNGYLNDKTLYNVDQEAGIKDLMRKSKERFDLKKPTMVASKPEDARAQRRGLEFTWEREDQIKKKYPHLFISKDKAERVDKTS
ncbi:retrotransposon protein, putative, ty1-copia subclass [Tanacetum coccineum]